MIKIQSPIRYNSAFIHFVASLIAGENYIGTNTGEYGTIIDLSDSTPANIQSAVNNLFASINSLSINTDKASITADDTDKASITHVTARASINYLVLLDGDEYDSDSVTAVAGTATLTLATALPGTYTIIIVNPDGSATGQTQIIAL